MNFFHSDFSIIAFFTYLCLFSFSFFSNALLNSLLTFFVLISLFGLFFAENRRFSGVAFFLVFKYFVRYLFASSPMKIGGFFDVPCLGSRGMSILRGIVVFGSRFFILSLLRVLGVNPVCLIMAKNAFSLILTRRVILMIRLLSIIAFFKSVHLTHRVSFCYDKVSSTIYSCLYAI